MNRFISLLVFAYAFTVASFAQPPSLPADLDAYVEQVQKTFAVPGISIAIVKGGKALLAKGFGVRKMGEPTPVDEKTLFGIASNTKAFTAVALALLVEEKKIEWDAPVVNYLPWFQLADPFVTRELTVRDLLVHRSGLGLGAGDLLWWPPSTYTRREIAQRLRHIPLATSFRSAYAYDNVLYLIAGELIETMSGMSWEEFIEKKIFARVGMNGSNTRHSDGGHGANTATPHARIEGKVKVANAFGSDNTNPAGGINTNAEDIAKWMIVQLDSGRVADGSSLFSAATTKELWSLVTPIPISKPQPELAALHPQFLGYGLGFFVRDYRGRKLVMHTGSLPGFVSRLVMVPEAKLGVAVLTNQESNEAHATIAYRVLDHYLGAEAFDWLSAYRKIRARNDSTNSAQLTKMQAARNTMSRPSLSLKAYAGTYEDAWYGGVTITEENNKLVLRFSKTPALVGDLEHWQYDTFIARWRDRQLNADAFITFSLNPDGTIERCKMKAVSPETDFSFDFHDLTLKRK
jgi:CubicO group peptidase (beta-lactamase class C family)